MNVSSRIRIVEREGVELEPSNDAEFLAVNSHWNSRGLVVLEDGIGNCVTVNAVQLKRAIDNATNH